MMNKEDETLETKNILKFVYSSYDRNWGWSKRFTPTATSIRTKDMKKRNRGLDCNELQFYVKNNQEDSEDSLETVSVTEDSLESVTVSEEVTTDSEAEEMSLAAPLSISQPFKDWVVTRRENIRPLATFFNTSNFQVPPSFGRFTKRFYKNIEYFQSNYVIIFLGLVVYCLISSPMLFMVMVMSGVAANTAARRNKDRKLTFLGHEITLAHQYGVISLCSLPFLLLAGAGAVVFWVLGASLVTVSVHAAAYNYDKLEVQGEEELLVGPIVEDV